MVSEDAAQKRSGGVRGGYPSCLSLQARPHDCCDFSRMRSRRVPVLKLGSGGPGGDARSLRCVRKASASVRKAFAKRP